MRRLLTLSALSLFVAACTTATTPSLLARQDHVTRAVEAMGGADAFSGVRTLAMKGTARHWEPEQSIVPGGEARLAGDSTFETLADFGDRVVRTTWTRNLVYPAPRTYTFTEIVTPDAGYVLGIDATARTKQSLESNPPAHAMSGLRLAAARRELQRTSPRLLLEMHSQRDRISPAPDLTVGNVSYPAVDYRSGDHVFTVAFDRTTGLPARIRALDYDNIWGDVTSDVVLYDWRTVAGLRIASSARYELNGRPVADIKIAEITPNPPASREAFTIPPAMLATASKPATGAVPYQWVLRRQYIGVYLDSDNPGYDARASSGLRLTELAPGVHHVVGGTHNSLIVEMADHLVVFDAPVSDAQSAWTLGAARQKFPGKPVKHLVLTHHHMDHAGGLRTYAVEGATIVVGKGAGEHLRRVLAAPFTRNPDLEPRDLGRTPVMEVDDRSVLTDGKRQVQVYLVDNPHSQAMLIGYVEDARLGFVSDLWSPGRDPLGAKLTPGQAAVVALVKKAGIAPEKFAGGHGGTGEYAPLAALEGK